MITLDYMVSDLELRLSKSKPSDDLEVTKEQMAYWIDIARDEVTATYLNQSKSIESSVVMEVEASPNDNGLIQTGVQPLDLKNSRGVLYVVDEHGKYWSSENKGMSKIVSQLKFSKSSSCNPTYTVSGSDIQLKNGDEIVYGSFTVGLVPSEVSRRNKTLSDRYYILPSTIKTILDLAEEIGLRELYGPGYYDITEDGNSNNVAR